MSSIARHSSSRCTSFAGIWPSRILQNRQSDMAAVYLGDPRVVNTGRRRRSGRDSQEQMGAIKVSRLLEENDYDLKLSLVAGRSGLARTIVSPRIQKPG